jgi:hypothetical protein
MTDTLWGVLIGGAIGLIGALGGNFIMARAQAKQHLKQLGFELGLKEWESHHEHAKTLYEKGDKVDGGIYPPWHFVYFNCRLAEHIAGGKLDPKVFRQILNETKTLASEINRDQGEWF